MNDFIICAITVSKSVMTCSFVMQLFVTQHPSLREGLGRLSSYNGLFAVWTDANDADGSLQLLLQELDIVAESLGEL